MSSISDYKGLSYKELGDEVMDKPKAFEYMDIDVSTDVLESTAGLIFIGKIFKKIGMVGSKSCLRKFKGSSAIKTMAGLLVQRRTKFEESRLFQNSSLFSKILELKKVPAPETVRLYLEKLSETCAGKLMATLRRINIRLLRLFQNSVIFGRASGVFLTTIGKSLWYKELSKNLHFELEFKKSPTF